MGRKKKQSGWKIFRQIIWFPFKIVGLGVYWTYKGIINLIRYIKNRKEAAKTQQKREALNAKQSFRAFDIVHRHSGDIRGFEKMLRENKSTIGIILGARGKGKTALGMRLLENIHTKTKRTCVAIGFKEESLPPWITPVLTTDDIPNSALVLIDEGGIVFSSRKAMTDANNMLSSLLLIARHKDLSIIFISQNSANLDVNAIRQADYLLLKPSSLLQKDFERKKIQSIYSELAEEFERHKNIQGLSYIYSDSFRGFVTNNLPTFWSEGISKSFK
jgi:hypothetical protein